MFTQLIVAHYIPLLIRRITSGPTGLDKPLGLMQSCLLGAFFPLAMDVEQGGYPNSSQSHRSRGSGCMGDARSRSKSESKGARLTWTPKAVKIIDPGAPENRRDTDMEFGTTEVSVPSGDADDSDAYGGAVSDAESSNPQSVPGDSVVGSDSDLEARVERKRARAQPRLSFVGDDRSRGESADHNNDPEVGNIGIFCGNWGLRASLDSTDGAKVRRTERSDRQIMRCPAQILILQEATEDVEHLLTSPAVAAEVPGSQGLSGRQSFKHFVVRGDEPEAAMLIAAREDNCTYLELLKYDKHLDQTYKDNRKETRPAWSRMLVCKVGFKQNVGHFGKSLTAMGVHGNARTMKIMWRSAYDDFWDRCASYIKEFGVEIMAGDFNMALTRVIPELRSRGLDVDCIVWYPWVHRTEHLFGQPLGFDSCGIFYIGGMVEVKLQWSLGHLDVLTAATDDLPAAVADNAWGLDWYSGGNAPGQPWKCYRSVRYDETDEDKDLRARLTELLTPSTTQEDLWRIPKRADRCYCPYLRFSQKPMKFEEWLVPQKNGAPEVHHGAHFPICVFTKNARARSKAAQHERDRKRTLVRHRNLQRSLSKPASRERFKQRSKERKERRRSGDTSRSREDTSRSRSHGDQPHYGAYVAYAWSGSWQEAPTWDGCGWRNDDWKSTPQTQRW